MVKLAKSAPTGSFTTDRRLQPRRKINNYPISVKKTDGARIKAHISDISAMGFQIRCSRLSAFILTARKIGFFEDKNLPDVEVIAVFPYKDGIKKINSICKLRYAAISEETNPIFTFTIGLQVVKHKGRSFEVIKEILYGHELPKLEPSKSRIIKSQPVAK